jgi:hypothetical protein
MWATSVELNVLASCMRSASAWHASGITTPGLWFEDEEEDEKHTFGISGIDPAPVRDASGSASVSLWHHLAFAFLRCKELKSFCFWKVRWRLAWIHHMPSSLTFHAPG